MTEPAISVRGLSKCYRLGTISRHTLVEEAEHWWHRLRGRDPRQHMGRIGHSVTEKRRIAAEQEGAEQFWALKDISFDVQPGEAIGIIGRNGAGKSTLLKILTRITEPTAGEAFINGRVSSLLEIGTGFHPELTGRENIFMNGAILGMKRAEIARKLDGIVAFAELDQFIDTPVKRYSSGMYVRLAFAVAAHLEPDILLVDEVLAVGDAGFQKRCLGKMGEVAREGRTVLFVSHNMPAIATLCARSLLLSSGSVVADSRSSEVIDRYYSRIAENDGSVKHAPGDNVAEFISARLVNKHARTTREVMINEPFSVEMTYRIKADVSGVVVPNFHFYTATGTCCFVSNAPGLRPQPPGVYVAECSMEGNLMNEGSYSIGVATTTYTGDRYQTNFFEQRLLSLTVIDPKIRDECNYGLMQTIPGILRPRLKWTVKKDMAV